jgi:hypothetical protein
MNQQQLCKAMCLSFLSAKQRTLVLPHLPSWNDTIGCYGNMDLSQRDLAALDLEVGHLLVKMEGSEWIS